MGNFLRNTENYVSPTGIPRFDFQMAAVAHAKGLVLNVGCGDDIVGLRERFGSKVINCDRDAVFVDNRFDAAVDTWPFNDGYVHTVILGDLLENLLDGDSILRVLREAYRVGYELCITTILPEDMIKEILALTGWTPYIFLQHEAGYCVMSYRS